MAERFIHYSNAHLDKVEDAEQGEKGRGHGLSGYKPNGLWFSAETDDPGNWGWREWCVGEEFRLSHLTHPTVASGAPAPSKSFVRFQFSLCP